MDQSIVLLATEAAGGGGATFIKGVAAFVAFVALFVGSVWLLTSMILGPKLGYLVTGACLFSVLTMLSAIWFVTGLGPKGEQGFFGSLGEETAWQPIATGQEIGEEDTRFGNLDLSGYPDGEGWVEPTRNRRLADLEEGQSTQGEINSAEPVMETLVSDAVSDIPGIREGVQDRVKGEVQLDPENFALTDFRMKETTVADKESIIAVGKAVPKASLNADLAGAPEGELVRFLVEDEAQVRAGDPLAEVRAGDQTIQLRADRDGRVIEFLFEEGDLVKGGVPYIDLDISGQPGAPPAVDVAAARVRGSEKVPSFIYLVASVALLIAHLVGLRRYEREHQVPQPQTA
jgi:biotin carboxyl carrier protein